MNQYQVKGEYRTWEADVATAHYVCKIVDAVSATDAEYDVDSELPIYATWLDRYPQATETLASIERRALADWNSGKPTASPLALAHARGEI
jgi:hypothetical protein